MSTYISTRNILEWDGVAVPEPYSAALEAGREVDALIAFFYYGWRWKYSLLNKNTNCGFFANDDSEYVRWNYRSDQFVKFLEWPDVTKRFGDWTRNCSHIGRLGNEPIGPQCPFSTEHLPHFSTNVQDAFALLDFIHSLYEIAFHLTRYNKGAKEHSHYDFVADNGFRPAYMDGQGNAIPADPKLISFEGSALTAPLAICRAALHPKALAALRTQHDKETTR